MFANGHKLILDRALDAVDDPALVAEYDALVLGNLREDVYHLPLVNRFVLGKGLTHYYKPGSRWGLWPLVPSAPTRTDWLFARAVRRWRAGDRRAGAFSLGRAVHLLSEMAAPVHAQVVLHWRGDPFEMYLEHRAAELRAMALPAIPTGARRAGELVHRLAVETQAFPCDRTRNLPGWLRWKLGRERRPSDEEVLAQVRALMPLGAAYTVALYRMFRARVG